LVGEDKSSDIALLDISPAHWKQVCEKSDQWKRDQLTNVGVLKAFAQEKKAYADRFRKDEPAVADWSDDRIWEFGQMCLRHHEENEADEKAFLAFCGGLKEMPEEGLIAAYEASKKKAPAKSNAPSLD
jgi:hypothetical protein